MKTSEIIKAGLNSGLYLTQHYWFCETIKRVSLDEIVTDKEYELAQDVIYNSIHQFPFLKSYLIDARIISVCCSYESPEYATAAHEHWNNLIAKLEAEGN